MGCGSSGPPQRPKMEGPGRAACAPRRSLEALCGPALLPATARMARKARVALSAAAEGVCSLDPHLQADIEHHGGHHVEVGEVHAQAPGQVEEAEKTTPSRTPLKLPVKLSVMLAVIVPVRPCASLTPSLWHLKTMAPQFYSTPSLRHWTSGSNQKYGTTLQNKQPAVAGSSSNDDWIADHFSADIMTGNNPLKAEKKLPAAVEEQSTPGVNAVTVDAFSDDHGEEPSESHMRVLLGCITSLLGDVDYNGDEFSFSLDIACKDFQPYNGDLVEIEFSEEQDTQSRKAILVKPLKHCHVNEVRVTKTDGRSGVLEDTIFFTLDSLKLPSRYVPQPDDVVNVVAVQSIQPSYFWRAVSMTPVQVV